MVKRKARLHDGKSGAAVAVRVRSAAKKNAIVEILSDGTLRVDLKAPSSEEIVNRALISYLAEILKVSRSNIDVVAGRAGKKLVTVLNVDAASLQASIMHNIRRSS